MTSFSLGRYFRRLRQSPWLWLLLLLVYYNANLRPIPSGDSLPTVTGAISLWLDGSFAVDRFAPSIEAYPDYFVERDGRHFGRYPRAQVVMAAPFYLPLALVPAAREMNPTALLAVGRVIEKLAASLLTVFSVWLFARVLALFVDRSLARWLALAMGLTTAVASTMAQALWSHTLAFPLLVGALWFGLRSGQPQVAPRQAQWLVAASALLGGLAFMVRPTEGLFLAGMGLALLLLRRNLPQVFVFACVGFAVIFMDAWLNPGTQASSGRDGTSPWFAQPLWLTLQGVLISPARGLFVYAPLVLLAIPGFWLWLAELWTRQGTRQPGATSATLARQEAMLVSAVFSVGMIAVTASWFGWMGGYCYGPRLLSTAMPFFFILTIPVWPIVAHRRNLQLLAGFLVSFGIFVHYVGIYHYPRGHWDDQPYPAVIDKDSDRFFDWRDNPISRSFLAGPATEPYEILAAWMRGGPEEASKVMERRGVTIY